MTDLQSRVRAPSCPAWRRCALLLTLAMVATSLAGCESIELALGMRIRLDRIPVTGLSASLVPASGLAPGASGALVVVATAADGKSYVTEGAGHGNVLFDSFKIDAQVVTVKGAGVVSLPADPRLSEGRGAHLSISANGHPDAVAELDVPVRYDVAYDANLSGRAGAAGTPGFDGTDGMPGSSGSIDPSNPSAGGDGGNGGNGGDGGDGGPGEPGPAVQVWLTLRAGTPALIQARVQAGPQDRLYLIDPAGGALAIEANGGAGGSGGRGGRGGAGGSGGSGSPSGASGMNGSDGRDGSDGAAGAAGTIRVTVDPLAQSFLEQVHLMNRSGAGRPGPAPTISVEPVAPLW